jgi:hypothetical protein
MWHCDWRSVSKSFCREIFITLWQLRPCFCGAPSLTRGRVTLFIWCWPLPARSFTGPSPFVLVTIFYCLRFETSFSSPPATRRVTVEVFDPASIGVWTAQDNFLQDNSSERTTSKTLFSIVVHVFVCARTSSRSRYLETGCMIPLFHCCVRVCCGRYLVMAAVYRVTT